MIRNVFWDYKATFKERWDYAWRYGNSTRFAGLFGAGFALADDGENEIAFFVYIFLLFFSTLVSATCMPYLSKAMHLCPMDRQERKQYLRSYYLLNMGFVAIIYIFVFSVLLLFRQVDILGFFVSGIGYMALMAIDNIKIVYRRDKDKNLRHFGAWKKAGLVITMFSSALVVLMFDSINMDLAEIIMISICTTLSLFFSGYMVIRFLPVMLEVNSVYEQCDRKFYDLELRKNTKYEEIDW